MDRNSILLYLSKFLNNEGCARVKPLLNLANDQQLEKINEKLPFLNLKNPILALILEFSFGALCVGRFYIKDYKTVAIVWVFAFCMFFSLLAFRITGSSISACAFLLFVLVFFIVWAWDLITIMKHTKEKNADTVLANLK